MTDEQAKPESDKRTVEVVLQIPAGTPAYFADYFYTSYQTTPFNLSVDVLFSRIALAEFFASGGGEDEPERPAIAQAVVKMPIGTAVQLAYNILNIASKLPEEYRKILGVRMSEKSDPESAGDHND